MIGTSLSHYLIEARLGEGGMGEVYLARDTRLDRQVAIKILPRRLDDSDGEGERRFVAEAKAASALNHPNIVTVHDFDRQGDVSFLVMERIEGDALGSVADAALPVERFYELALQISGALAAAHAAGIVHHDVKPANVMVSRSGTVKVVDFGLARRALTGTGPPDPRPADAIERPPALEDGPTVRFESGSAGGGSPSLTQPGTILGTIAYMAPEQLEGRRGDTRSDVFSLGVTFFELLSGRLPFANTTPVTAMMAILRDPPRSLLEYRRDLPAGLVALVESCLEKDPARRPRDAGWVRDQLERLRDERHGKSAARLSPAARWLLAASLALLLAALAVLATWWRQAERERWAREEAVPEIERLFDGEQVVEAFDLARRARAAAPEDAQVEQLWTNIVIPVDVLSEPPGADVALRSYNDTTGAWLALGKTPLLGQALPFPLTRIRLSKDGYEPLESAPEIDAPELRFRLFAPGDSPPGMVLVAAGPSSFLRTAVELPDFWIDRTEVTNEEFQRFVDAGGYRRPELWPAELTATESGARFEQAVADMVDQTGRPGPAGWSLGTFPEGKAQHPVEGIGWYEARAYAAFAGKSLPTVFHWERAAANDGVFSDVIEVSNFSAQATVPVASSGGLGHWGTEDMAGNVKEWCLNATGSNRFALGGAYTDAKYQYVDPDSAPPAARRAGIGLRLIRQQQPLAPELTIAIENRPVEDPKPVDDATFAAYARLLDYDPRPLEARVEAVEDGHAVWRKETVSYTAAYGDQRLTAYLFLPRNARPPYQTVVFFPGNDATMLPSSKHLWLRMVEFFVRSGRAMIYPVYQGTYDRRIQGPLGPNRLRELRTQRTQDVRRTLDYLLSRADVDADRIAYYGLSLGANLAPLPLATDSRFRTAILFGGGLSPTSAPVEVRIEHFLPRITIPVLFVGGRHDFLFPLETSQRPYFALLGTPPESKRHFVFEGGHIPTEFNAAVREMLGWSDRILGPVERAE